MPQRSGTARRNDHPAAFEPQQLAALLMSLRVRAEDDGSASTLSSRSRLERLSAAVSKALVRASPRQDVGFVIYRRGENGLFSGSKPSSKDWTWIEDRLTQLERLREKKLISEQDYQSKKDELLSQLP